MIEISNHLGLDLGVSTFKLAVVRDGRVVHLDHALAANPVETITGLLGRLGRKIPLETISTAGITGREANLYEEQEGWQMFTPYITAILGLKSQHPDVGTIIDIGKRGSWVIGKVNGGWDIVAPTLCAGGKGTFIEQQARRFEGVTIENFGDIALQSTKPAFRLVQRCGVFAGSDLIGRQADGASTSELLKAIAYCVANMCKTQWGQRKFEPEIYFIGGVAANKAVVSALSDILKIEVKVPEHYLYQQAIGAAIASRRGSKPKDFYPQSCDFGMFYIPNPLKRPTSSAVEWKPKEIKEGEIKRVYLGVDIGSTSTKAVLLDTDCIKAGKLEDVILDKIYLQTEGQPLVVIKKIMKYFADKYEGKVEIIASGYTGSGRYIGANFCGFDRIDNEISAQARAAGFIDPNITTVIEIGGQDAKFVILRNGVPVRFAMNRSCAAGTGSFVKNAADQLGTHVETGEFADLSFEAAEVTSLGDKCGFLMGIAVEDLLNKGVSREVLAASVSRAFALNYLSKVVPQGEPIEGRIMLLGAPFWNTALEAAFREALPDREITIPQHNEVTGAIGAALLVYDNKLSDSPSKFRGFTYTANLDYQISHPTCTKCEQGCTLSQLNIKGQKSYMNSLCELLESESDPGKRIERKKTPFDDRKDALFR